MVTQSKRTIYTTSDGTVFLSEEQALEYEAKRNIAKWVERHLPSDDFNRQHVVDAIYDNGRSLYEALGGIHAARAFARED